MQTGASPDRASPMWCPGSGLSNNGGPMDNTDQTLHAAGGLSATVRDGRVHIGFAGHDDWFGPGRFTIGDADVELSDSRTVSGVDDIGSWTATMWLSERAASPRIDASLAAYDDEPILVFSLRAPAGFDGAPFGGASAGTSGGDEVDAPRLATGTFEQPSVAWPAFRPTERAGGGVPEATTGFGFQYMEFALPTATDANLAGWLRWPFRPAVMMPLLLVAEDATVMIAPLDAFHEQIVAVPADAEHAADGVRCGWHGDLESVPKGFSTEMAIIAGADARECLDRWAAILVERGGAQRLPRGIDSMGSHLSYWTDNGAAYWYRTAVDADGEHLSVTDTLVQTLADLRDRKIPYRSVQLDSWFYPHRTIRPFDTDEWDVPPTGLDLWQARKDILPEGISALSEALDNPPLATHCRHLSSDSPYVELYDCWIDGEYAHPKGSDLYESYFDSAVGWGVETFEHDWLVECFLGVRGLRAEPGRATAWQQGVNAALAERGMTAQWCMATPADFMATTSLSQVTSIRTSGDHGYLVPPELLWAWFLYTNAFARPLGLWPFKDVFRSDGHGGSTDPEAEAALSALSAGPVGIGDALGGADPAIVARTCRADGLLVAPDAPIAATARSFLHHGVLTPEPVVGATHTAHSAGRWSYVITMNCHDSAEHESTTVSLSELGDDQPLAGGDAAERVACWNVRTGELQLVGPEGFAVELGAKAWDLRVLAPVVADGSIALIGDVGRYATVGRQRVSDVVEIDGGVRVRVAGSDEQVQLAGWADGTVAAAVATPGASTDASVLTPDSDGRWDLVVDLPAEPGWVTVDLVVS